MDVDYPSDFAPNNDNRSAQVIQIDSGKHVAAVVLCALISGASVIFAWNATEKANRSEERADLLQYYLLELDAKVVAAGIKQPDESIAGKLAKEQP